MNMVALAHRTDGFPGSPCPPPPVGGQLLNKPTLGTARTCARAALFVHANYHISFTMNTVNEESKSAAIKTLAIVGFIAAIVAGLWIAVQAITLIPGAFSSLASLADSLYGEKGLVIKAEKNIVNSAEPLRVSWIPLRHEGTYVFSYRCVDGISAETRNADGDIVRIPCNDEIAVAEGSFTRVEQTTDVVFTSEKQRFTDVPYTFAFFKNGEEESMYERSGVVTVVNATIPQTGAVAGAQDDTDTKTPVVTKPAVTKPVVTTPVVTKPTPTPKPQPVYYKTVPVTTTAYPVSNPNGQTDLEVTLIGIGEVKNGVFVNDTTLEAGDTAALRFSVKNIGTKTSGEWTYAATFPADGDNDLTSSKQSPLLPSERATFTITFTVTEDEGSETARVSVSTSGDAKSANNSASKSVKIAD